MHVPLRNTPAASRKAAEIVRSPQSPASPLPSSRHTGSYLPPWLVLLLSALILTWPAYWNGFPLVFSDTGTYIAAAIEKWVPGDRPIFYSIFIFVLGKSISIYSVVLAQALLAVYVIRQLLVLLLNRYSDVALLTIAVTCATATPLPWVASWLMPDIFAPFAVLIAYIIVAGQSRLTATARAALLFIFILANIVHTGILLLSLCLVSSLFLASFLVASVSARGAAQLAGALVLAFLCLAGVNYLAFGRFTINAGSQAFLASRLINNGLMQKYLEKHCKRDPAIVLCPFEVEIKEFSFPDEFLWGSAPAVAVQSGAYHKNADRLSVLVRLVALEYPWDVVSVSLKDGLRLLTYVTPCEEEAEYSFCFEKMIEGRSAARRIKSHYGHVASDFALSRQQTSTLHYGRFAPWHRLVIGFFACLTVLVGVYAFYKSDEQMLVLILYVAAAVIMSAAIHGALAGAYPRYQARIVWVVVLIPLIAVFRYVDFSRAVSLFGHAARTLSSSEK